jgi:putative glutamine amidotransferase
MFRGNFLLAILFLFSLEISAGAQTCIILSKSYGKGEYEQWLLRKEPDLKLVSLYHANPDSASYWLEKADGFLMTGGEDIYPGRYGRAKDTIDCGSIDFQRDSLEFQMLDAAFRRKKPVFGICRGMQLLNVYMGGSLIADLPSSPLGLRVIHRDGGPVRHAVRLLPAARRLKIETGDSLMVLSNHHQGIKKSGRGLIPLAKSADGLIEAFTVSRKLPFIMAVQWHPERMHPENPLSSFFATSFLKACKKSP